MKQECIDKLKEYNNSYIARYLGISHIPNTLDTSESQIPHIDTRDKPICDLDYYDLMMINLLMYRHYTVECSFTANIAEIVATMAQEGLVKMNVMSSYDAKEFCYALTHNRIPSYNLIYQYIAFLERYNHTVLPYWFYYTLMLWAFVESKHFNHTSSRSRYYVGVIHNYGLTPFTDYQADRNHDVFDIREKIIRLVYMVFRDKKYEKDSDTMILHLIDSLRIFSIITFAALISRSCKWSIFKPIGGEVLHQRLVEHQLVVNEEYQRFN